MGIAPHHVLTVSDEQDASCQLPSVYGSGDALPLPLPLHLPPRRGRRLPRNGTAFSWPWLSASPSAWVSSRTTLFLFLVFLFLFFLVIVEVFFLVIVTGLLLGSGLRLAGCFRFPRRTTLVLVLVFIFLVEVFVFLFVLVIVTGRLFLAAGSCFLEGRRSSSSSSSSSSRSSSSSSSSSRSSSSSAKRFSWQRASASWRGDALPLLLRRRGLRLPLRPALLPLHRSGTTPPAFLPAFLPRPDGEKSSSSSSSSSPSSMLLITFIFLNSASARASSRRPIAS